GPALRWRLERSQQRNLLEPRQACGRQLQFQFEFLWGGRHSSMHRAARTLLTYVNGIGLCKRNWRDRVQGEPKISLEHDLWVMMMIFRSFLPPPVRRKI